MTPIGRHYTSESEIALLFITSQCIDLSIAYSTELQVYNRGWSFTADFTVRFLPTTIAIS